MSALAVCDVSYPLSPCPPPPPFPLSRLSLSRSLALAVSLPLSPSLSLPPSRSSFPRSLPGSGAAGRELGRHPQAGPCATRLRPAYALPGTDVAYRATSGGSRGRTPPSKTLPQVGSALRYAATGVVGGVG
eukprot:2855971-Rhodomonas_salina.1